MNAPPRPEIRTVADLVDKGWYLTPEGLFVQAQNNELIYRHGGWTLNNGDRGDHHHTIETRTGRVRKMVGSLDPRIDGQVWSWQTWTVRELIPITPTTTQKKPKPWKSPPPAPEKLPLKQHRLYRTPDGDIMYADDRNGRWTMHARASEFDQTRYAHLRVLPSGDVYAYRPEDRQPDMVDGAVAWTVFDLVDTRRRVNEDEDLFE